MTLHSPTMAEVAEPVFLDSETSSESEDATASRGSRAEVIADSHFEKTQNADSRDRSDDTVIHALMARLASCIRVHVEEALLPLVSALRSREENEEEHRKKLLHLEMEKLVLERKKLHFKQRRAAAPFPGVYRNSAKSNRHKVRVKKNPPCAAQHDQAVGNDAWLREKNKSIAGGAGETSVLRLQAELDMLAEREAQKNDF